MKFSTDNIERLNQDIETLIEQYRDYSVTDLAIKFNLNVSAKNLLNLITTRLIRGSSSEMLNHLNEDVDFCFKTIKLDKYGKLKESMSLPVFKYCEIVSETWETSTLRKYLVDKIFAFTVYKADGREQYLNKIVIWKIPKDVLDGSIKKVWQKMHNTLSSGKVVKYIDNSGRYFSYFPRSTENKHMHVRPHANNRQDTFQLPVADKLTGLVKYPKHSFWINKSYIIKIIMSDDNNE